MDPLTKNRVWRVTDRRRCPQGGRHFYSYWPLWNQNGKYLLVQCEGWSLVRPDSAMLLIRDSDLRVIKNVLEEMPAGVGAGKLFWSWVDADTLYALQGSKLLAWNPFRSRGRVLKDFSQTRVGDLPVAHFDLAYVSFDDRYVLVNLLGDNPRTRGKDEWEPLGLLSYDRQTGGLAILDLTRFAAYDEAVFTKDNHVWVLADLGQGFRGLRYTLDFREHSVVSSPGHHAHGLLPDGTPVTIKAASNRDCPAGSKSGNPVDKGYPDTGWKPTAVILDVSGARREHLDADSKEPILWKLGCHVPGQHNFDHFSWNNAQQDQFFISTAAYGNPEADPLANAILRVRLRFRPDGSIADDEIDVLAYHRSGRDYWAQPRVSCNQQGTRCLFASSMVNNAGNRDPQANLYIVDVPAK